MNECNEENSAGKVTIHEFASQVCHQNILNDFDDPDKIVIVNSVLNRSIDFVSFLKVGQNSPIKVQSYTRSVCDGEFVIKEDASPPFIMTCKSYYDYYKMCNKNFDNLTREREDTEVNFKCIDQKGQPLNIDLRVTVLYAIDIPLELLSVDLDCLFKKAFMLSHLCLPGQKHCYYQFVSKPNDSFYLT